MDLSRLFTLDNIRGILWAFCRGFADSLRGAVDLFFLDSQALQRKESKLIQRDFHKEFLLNRESPAREIESLAKRRAVERRERSKKVEKREEPKVLERTLKCCALNGCVFWFSIIVFESVLLPLIQTVLYVFLGGSEYADKLWNLTLPLLSLTFSTLWVLPFFLLSKIVNAIWFQDIADSAFRSTRGRPQMMSSISVMIADTIFSIFIESIFLVQGRLCSMLPIQVLGNFINLVHMCLLHSLYSFEYKWFNQGLELHKRLAYVETNWPYFLGFGFPLAVLTSMPESLIISGCVFSILFPLFIVSANQAQVVLDSCDVQIHLFSPTIAISNAILARTIKSK